jgi:hypothetical protein
VNCLASSGPSEPEQRLSANCSVTKNQSKDEKLPQNEKAGTIQPMNDVTHLEHSASSSRGSHEGEPSIALCDRLSRTRVNSQRQLPTDHDYAVPTREYQTDQSSLKPAQAAARPVLGEQQKQRQKIHRSAVVDTVTPYQGKAFIERDLRRSGILKKPSVPLLCPCW